jgi:hypothetical protein
VFAAANSSTRSADHRRLYALKMRQPPRKYDQILQEGRRSP